MIEPLFSKKEVQEASKATDERMITLIKDLLEQVGPEVAMRWIRHHAQSIINLVDKVEESKRPVYYCSFCDKETPFFYCRCGDTVCEVCDTHHNLEKCAKDINCADCVYYQELEGYGIGSCTDPTKVLYEPGEYPGYKTVPANGFCLNWCQ